MRRATAVPVPAGKQSLAGRLAAAAASGGPAAAAAAAAGVETSPVSSRDSESDGH